MTIPGKDLGFAAASGATVLAGGVAASVSA
jgi:hypothetical protein